MFTLGASWPPLHHVSIRKGTDYGTAIVDLEHRRVVDLLVDGSAARTADWLGEYPEIAIARGDRAGLYADVTCQGAPRARQIADRFHLMKIFQETIERQLSGFETVIQEAIIQAGDDEDTPGRLAIARSAHCTAVMTPESLLRRGRNIAR